MDGPRGGLTGDLDSGYLVAQLERQLEMSLRDGLSWREPEFGLAQALTTRRERMQHTFAGGAAGPHNGDFEAGAAADIGRDTQRFLARARFDHRQAGPSERRESFQKTSGAFVA